MVPSLSSTFYCCIAGPGAGELVEWERHSQVVTIIALGISHVITCSYDGCQQHPFVWFQTHQWLCSRSAKNWPSLCFVFCLFSCNKVQTNRTDKQTDRQTNQQTNKQQTEQTTRPNTASKTKHTTVMRRECLGPKMIWHLIKTTCSKHFLLLSQNDRMICCCDSKCFYVILCNLEIALCILFGGSGEGSR